MIMLLLRVSSLVILLHLALLVNNKLINAERIFINNNDIFLPHFLEFERELYGRKLPAISSEHALRATSLDKANLNSLIKSRRIGGEEVEKTKNFKNFLRENRNKIVKGSDSGMLSYYLKRKSHNELDQLELILPK